MSYDTKYRPVNFSDVLGQVPTIKVLRRFLATGTGRHQSYLFAGPYGEGKTTLGRILAMGLLCEAVTPEGDPCGTCLSCRSMIENGTSLDFVEVDAATNSGKEDIKRITEEIQYATFSGKRRIYLFDEAHQLSPHALDALLKPLEENYPNSPEKKLVCIFCTTEPEKMRATVLSRCAPAFIIQPVSPEQIADRLGYICQQEGIEYDKPVLQSIAEITECHIRDAIKAVEGVSMLGKITVETVTSYLHLDLNVAYLEILEVLGQELPLALDRTKKVLMRASPATIYGKLAEVSMLAYQTHIGAIPPAFWDADRLRILGARHGEVLLNFVEKFSSRPGRPTTAMLLCDLSFLHYGGGGVQAVSFIQVQVPQYSPQPVSHVPSETVPEPVPLPVQKVGGLNPEPVPQIPVRNLSSNVVSTIGDEKDVQRNIDGVVPYSRAIGVAEKNSSQSFSTVGKVTRWELDPTEFAFLLALKISELRQDPTLGPTGRVYLGCGRTDSSGGDEG